MLRTLKDRMSKGLILVCLGVGLGLAVMVTAEQIERGVDLWHTPPGGAVVDLDFPAGFFCGGESEAFSRSIALKGDSIATYPESVGATDTIVMRENDAVFSEGSASTSVKIVALSLVSRSALQVGCPDSTFEYWNVRVGLEGEQTSGLMNIFRDEPADAGGTFDSGFEVRANVTFTNRYTGEVTTPIGQTDMVMAYDASWSQDPVPESPIVTGGFYADADGDGTYELWVPVGTSAFFPGLSHRPQPGCSDPPCHKPVKHEGPHLKTCNSPSAECCVTTGGGSGASGSGTGSTPVC